MTWIVLDTGPLVAFLDRRDRFHEWAVDQWKQVKPPLLTCEAVIAEACFLLRRTAGGTRAVMKALASGAIAAGFRLDGEIEPVRRLMRRYENVPMSLADACLVRMSEIHSESAVLTIDGDFRVYRRSGRQVIPLLIPPDTRRSRG